MSNILEQLADTTKQIESGTIPEIQELHKLLLLSFIEIRKLNHEVAVLKDKLVSNY